MSNFLQQQPIILASASKVRQKLLHSLGLEFQIIPSDCQEDVIKQTFNKENIPLLAEELAAEKALLVSRNYPDFYIIAADQLCIIDKQILDKPGNHHVAVQHLQLLRGKTHQQIAGICLAKAGKILWLTHYKAELTMRSISDKTIDTYLHLDQPYQSCGAYNFEGKAKWLFSEIQGSECTILGLPLMPLVAVLMNLQVVSY